MNLENVTVEMRPRSDWEAADFGVRLIRRDAAAVYCVWFAITLPLLVIALGITLFSPYPLLAPIVYWWCEPIADGPMLRIVSRRLFGEDSDVRATISAVPSLVWRNRIFLLTPYRFHPARSIAMPVTQLEGLSGSARRSRAKVLNRRILNHGIGVTVAYQHLFIALYFGVFLIGYALVPSAYQDTMGQDWVNLFWEIDGRAANVLNLLVTYGAQSALQPWFVGAGFGLYINCRTRLEAWDIEVAFRRMVQRRATSIVALALVAGLGTSAAFSPGTVLAQESAQEDRFEVEEASVADPGISGYWSDEETKPALEAVLANEKLSTTEEIEEWRAIDSSQSEQKLDSEFLSWLSEAIIDLGRLLAYIVEFGFWLSLVIALFIAYATRKRWLPLFAFRSTPTVTRKKVVLASGELSAEDFSGDIPAEVARLWSEGSKRNALSLLYRASVFAAVTQHGVKLPPSATEGACISAVDQQIGATQSGFFRSVVSVWIQCAYGFQEPDDEQVLSLCDEWHLHYGSTP